MIIPANLQNVVRPIQRATLSNVLQDLQERVHQQYVLIQLAPRKNVVHKMNNVPLFHVPQVIL